MSFYGTSFTFDGISCEEFGLMLYDLDSATQGASSWATGTKIKEERIPGRVRSIYYGKTEESNLEFTLIFGADETVALSGEPIDRSEMQAVSMWLMGPSDYRYLQIDQPDMVGVRYRCMITDLKTVELYGKKWAFSCKVHCDSPYAYTLPQTYTFSVDTTSSYVFYSRSTANVPYYPHVTIKLSNSADFSIANDRSSGAMTFTGLPQASDTIDIYGETGIVTATSGLSMYPYFNFSFLQLLPGKNTLSFTGTGTVEMTCEFPVNVGG